MARFSGIRSKSKTEVSPTRATPGVGSSYPPTDQIHWIQYERTRLYHWVLFVTGGKLTLVGGNITLDYSLPRE